MIMKNLLFQMVFAFIVYLALFSCNSESKQKNRKQATGETGKDTTIVFTGYKSEQNVQTFKITTSRQQTINGKQGTVVTFPIDCFGNIQGKVKIELIECYSILDMIFNGLSTYTTDGKLLESDGMIYLNALSVTGDTLKIKQGKVLIQMPTKQEKKGIKIFEGIKNNNSITWNLSSEKLTGKVLSSQTNSKNGEYTSANPIIIERAKDQNSADKLKSGQSQIIIDKQIKNENIVNYVFNISKMGWQNCDRYIEGETKQLIVNVPKESTCASYYLVLRNYNSSAVPKQTTDGKLSFIIPVNEPYTIVALSSKGDDTYFNMKDYPGGKDEVEFSRLNPVTRQELTDILIRKFGKDIWNRPLG